jgi:GGDEF domain-containing protein
LSALLREQDKLARLGGDEFAGLSPHLTNSGDAIGVANKIIESLSLPYFLKSPQRT